jgi:hypothetical protein
VISPQQNILALQCQPGQGLSPCCSKALSGARNAEFIPVPCWHAGSANGTTVIKVIGRAGTPISGSYVQNGYRVPINGRLPFTLTHDGLSECEILKGHPDGTLALAAQYDVHGWHSEVVSEAGEGLAGLRVRVRNGLFVEKIKQ